MSVSDESLIPSVEELEEELKNKSDSAVEFCRDKIKQRVIYARKPGEKDITFIVEGGEPITPQIAAKLKATCWGGSDRPIKAIWIKQGIVFNPPEKTFAYGLKTQKNDTKNLLMCLQAYFLKFLLFGKAESMKGSTKRFTRQKSDKQNSKSSLHRMQPNKKMQIDMMIEGLTEILFKASEDGDAFFVIPGEKACFDPPQHYLNDNITEKLNIYVAKNQEDMATILRHFEGNIMAETGVGLLCVLYSIILSRTCERIKEDLQNQECVPLVDASVGECTTALLNLVITGKATPYLHNLTATIDGEERSGICNRCDIGYLISTENKQSMEVGSYMKTPILPMWLTKCEGQMGVLFNPNKNLLRTRGAENRFQLYYYANFEFGKTDPKKETLLTIDSRPKKKDEVVDKDFDQVHEKPPPLLETAIKTKWESATIDWHGITPYIW